MQSEDLLLQYAAGERSFQGADLRDQSFRGQDLSGADFSGADIRGTDFYEAVLTQCNFARAQGGLTRRRYLIMQSCMISVVSLYAFSVSFISGVLCVTFLLPAVRAVSGFVAPVSALLSYLLFVLLILRDGFHIRTLAIVMLLAIASAPGVVAAVVLAGPQAVTIAVALAGAATLAVTTTVIGGACAARTCGAAGSATLTFRAPAWKMWTCAAPIWNARTCTRRG